MYYYQIYIICAGELRRSLTADPQRRFLSSAVYQSHALNPEFPEISEGNVLSRI